MEPILEAIQHELSTGIPDAAQFTRAALRLVMALALGAAVGVNRERTGKPAGVRTHMLVSLGAAMFVLVPSELGLHLEDLSRVVQGVATGIGFLGAGAILKVSTKGEIKGLTTAAGIWVTAAVGVACGLGLLGVALLSIFLAWITLAVMDSFSRRFAPENPHYHLANEKGKGEKDESEDDE
jgi:putative Mg2+ transporter-C (MgtC) family protein